jgi:hypothetical protein
MPKFESFDRRRYATLSAREGYARWAPTYEATIKQDMDERLLERVTSVDFAKVARAACSRASCLRTSGRRACRQRRTT